MKMVIVGDYGIGKTSLVHRYVHNRFSTFYKTTMGVDITSKTIQIPDAKLEVEIQVWDLSGQQTFAKVRHRFYEGAGAAMLVCDITQRSTIESIPNWIAEIEENLGKIAMALVGNKKDLSSKREINVEELQKLASEIGIQLFETSAKTGENVEEVFIHLANRVLPET